MTDKEIIKNFEKLTKYSGFTKKAEKLLCNVIDLINRQKEEIETMQNAARAYETAYHRIKSEVIQEFAKRFEAELYNCGVISDNDTGGYITSDVHYRLDNLVKEMEENDFNE